MLNFYERNFIRKGCFDSKMKIERTRNAGRNIVFGSILKIYQIAAPFVMRTIMIYWMGVEYLGLNSLFTSILQVLNLAELGVGNALVFSMYKPIAEDDEASICALMGLYRKYYHWIGLVIAVFGFLFTPFLPIIVKSDLPADVNLYVLYWLNLSVTVASYWLFAYKNSLLIAHQRNDIVSKVNLITTTIQYLCQFSVIIFFKNYYLYVLSALLIQILTNIVTAYVANSMYRNYHPKGKLQEAKVIEINRRIRDLFTSKIGSVVVNSVDTIVISAFLGLTTLAIYQNYFYIISSIMGFVLIIFQSCTAGIGNSLVVESKEKNLADLHKFTFMISWLSGICASCLLCLYQPFMEIWVGKSLMLDFSIVICLCCYFYIYEINQLLNTYKDAGGIWHEDRFRPLVTALANLIMNILLVQLWGLYGVILSTIISTLVVGMPWLFHNLFTVLFKKEDFSGYFKKLLSYFLISVMSCLLCYIICSQIYLLGWLGLIVKGIICVFVSNLIFILIYHNKEEFFQLCLTLNNVTRGKIKYFTQFIRYTKGKDISRVKVFVKEKFKK